MGRNKQKGRRRQYTTVDPALDPRRAQQQPPRDMPPSSSGSEYESEGEVETKPKSGIASLIEIENPNRVKPKEKSMKSLGGDDMGSRERKW